MMAYNVLQSAELIGDACVSFTEKCVVGIAPNYQAIENHLNNSFFTVKKLKHKMGMKKQQKS